MLSFNSNVLKSLIISSFVLSGCATMDDEENLIPLASTKAQLGEPAAQQFYSASPQSTHSVYKSGDFADVQFFNEGGISGKYIVDFQGNSNFPYIGPVKVAGLTNLQLQNRLIELYGQDYFQNPSIRVQMESQGLGNIIVDGAVSNPSVLELTQTIRLTEAIARVGGLSQTGDPNQVFVVRQNGTERTPFRVDLDAVRLAQAPDPILTPSDIIFVQKEGEKFDYDDILRTIPLLNFALIAARQF